MESIKEVATREGGVDRNYGRLSGKSCREMSPPARVAWIETRLSEPVKSVLPSPPARVAWIETQAKQNQYLIDQVATREGGVDRNFCLRRVHSGPIKSPPARVAWIET